MQQRRIGKLEAGRGASEANPGRRRCRRRQPHQGSSCFLLAGCAAALAGEERARYSERAARQLCSTEGPADSRRQGKARHGVLDCWWRQGPKDDSRPPPLCTGSTLSCKRTSRSTTSVPVQSRLPCPCRRKENRRGSDGTCWRRRPPPACCCSVTLQQRQQRTG